MAKKWTDVLSVFLKLALKKRGVIAAEVAEALVEVAEALEAETAVTEAVAAILGKSFKKKTRAFRARVFLMPMLQ